MLVLCCTTKAFRKLGSKPQAVDVSHDRPTLGDWYVNTIDYLNDGNLLLACMHTESLFVLMVPLKPEMDASAFAHAFLGNLLTRMIELETPPEAARRILSAYGESAILAKNSDRKVAGHLNSALTDLRYLLEFEHLQLTEGNRLNVPPVEHELNSTPRGCSTRQTIWPLPAFWRSLRRVCPELSARTPLPGGSLAKFDGPGLEDALRAHLPARMAARVLAAIRDLDVLFTADQLRLLAHAARLCLIIAQSADRTKEGPTGRRPSLGRHGCDDTN